MGLVFKRLELRSRGALTALTDRFPSYSDFNFTSLYAWDIDNSLEVVWFGSDGIGIRFRDYQLGSPVYSLLCASDVVQATAALIRHARREASVTELGLVPEFCAQKLAAHQDFKVLPDAANHDYIISMPALATLNGAKFRQMRRGVQALYTRHPEARYISLDATERSQGQELIEVFKRRESQKNADCSQELQAFKRLISAAEPLGIHARGIEVKGRLCAFILFERLGGRSSMGHFWKADTNYPGAYQALMHHVAQELKDEGIQYMNIQQDLGIAGLRQAKQFFRPISQLKKFTVSLVEPTP